MFSITSRFNAYSSPYVNVPTHARTIFQKHTKFEGDYLFDIFPPPLKLPAIFYERHILGTNGKGFLDKLLRRCDFEMLFLPNPQNTGVTALQWNRSL